MSRGEGLSEGGVIRASVSSPLRSSMSRHFERPLSGETVMRLWRRFLGTGAAACVAILFMQSALAQGAKAVRYDIPAQSLESALAQFAVQSKRQVLFDPGTIPGRATQGLKGEYTAEGALQALLDGTGLGLALCREVVESHAGRIELESTGPSGSTFLVVLPAEP